MFSLYCANALRVDEQPGHSPRAAWDRVMLVYFCILPAARLAYRAVVFFLYYHNTVLFVFRSNASILLYASCVRFHQYFFHVLGPRRTGNSQVSVDRWQTALAYLSWGGHLAYRARCTSHLLRPSWNLDLEIIAERELTFRKKGLWKPQHLVTMCHKPCLFSIYFYQVS